MRTNRNDCRCRNKIFFYREIVRMTWTFGSKGFFFLFYTMIAVVDGQDPLSFRMKNNNVINCSVLL